MKILSLIFKVLWLMITQPLITLVLVLLIVYFVRPNFLASFFGTGNKPLPVARTVELSTGQVAQGIVLQCPKPEKTYSRILILPVRNDRENAIENKLREEFQKRKDNGWYNVIEKSNVTQAIEQLQSLTFGTDASKESKELSKDEIVKIGKSADAEFVLYTTVNTFEPGENKHEIDGQSILVDVQNGESKTIPFSNIANKPSDGSGASVSMFGQSFVWHLTLIVVLTLVWPLLLMPVMRQIIARENNRDNLIAIITMAIIPVVIGLLLMRDISGILLITCLVFQFVIATVWIGAIMNKIAAK